MSRQALRITDVAGLFKTNSLGNIPQNGYYNLKNVWSKGFLGATYPAPRMLFKTPYRDTAYKTTMDITGKTRGLGYFESPTAGRHITHALGGKGVAGSGSATTKAFTIEYKTNLTSENYISLCLTETGITNTVELFDSICAVFTPQESDIATLSWKDPQNNQSGNVQRIYWGGVWTDIDPATDIYEGQGFQFFIGRYPSGSTPVVSETWTLSGDSPATDEIQNTIYFESSVYGREHLYAIPYNLSITTLQSLATSINTKAAAAGFTPTSGDTFTVTWRDNENQVDKTVTATYTSSWAYTGDTTQAVTAGDGYLLSVTTITNTMSFDYPYTEDFGSLWELDLDDNDWKQLKPPLLGGSNTGLTGNATFVSGSANVVGTGTAFTTELTVGQYLRLNVAPSQWYMVKTITDNTHIVLIDAVAAADAGTGTGTLESYDFNPYHFCFQQYNDKMYSCGTRYAAGSPAAGTKSDGGAIRKWDAGADWANAPYIRDKGNITDVRSLTGTYTFSTSSAAVVGSGGATFTTELEPGDWITVDSTVASPTWYEVKSITDSTHLTLMTVYAETGAGETSVKAAPIYKDDYAMFITEYQDSLIILENNGHVIIRKSQTGDFENITGTGSYVEYLYNETVPAGVATLGEYLFVFLSESYRVYKWTGDTSLPFKYINTFQHGCTSHRTIQNIGDYLIYFTGYEVRATNGSNDVSISNPQIQYEFLGGAYSKTIDSYYSLGANDDLLPFAVYDKVFGTYSLYFPKVNGTTGKSFIYDVNSKTWIGELSGVYEGHGIMVNDNTAIRKFVWASSASTSDQLYKYNTEGDYSNFAEVLSGFLNFGEPNKKKRIYSVDIKFYTEADTDVDLTLTSWEDVNDVLTQESYNLLESDSDDNVYKIKSFTINKNVYDFQFKIAETVNTGSTGWGIDSITIYYEVVETP